MSSSSTDTTQSRGVTFDSRVDEVKFDKPFINEIVMGYLIREGYPQAATNFAREANLEPKENADSMEERVAVRNFICAGQIKEAIERINEFNPEILDKHKSLLFALLRLQLIELIRLALENPDNGMMTAVEFAEENLAPLAPTSPEHLRDLEETMTLLIFQPGKVHPSLAYLLEPELKKNVAKQVNEAMLESVGGGQRNKLYELVKLREWSENKAREAKRQIPSRIDIGLNPARLDGEDSLMTLDGNGHGDNVAMS